MDIVGRTRERRILARCETSVKPEFVAVYGRRRVGKTFLIVEHFKNKFTLSTTGIFNGGMKEQLAVFHGSLKKHFQAEVPVPTSWIEAFCLLEDQLRRDSTALKKILFIDELPWFDTPKSGFLSALEHFWNAFASRRPDIVLIVCGSAASWMIRNLINNYGGLYNRVTERIVLEPFPLSDCEVFYRNSGIAFNRLQIAEAYMILGGIPFYMDSMDKTFGLSQNIDLLFFEKNAKLDGEFKRLYHSLFRHAGNHILVVEELAKSGTGLTRPELSKASGLSGGGGLTKVLDELEACGLIGRSFDFRRRKNGDTFKLTDFFSLFYFRYLKQHQNGDPRFWTNYLTDPAHRAWCGYAFERLCMAHVQQIKQRLGITGVITETYAFRSTQKKDGAQIDLVIDRKDDTINLCECKFSNRLYELTDKDVEGLERKREVFINETKTRKSVHLTMITTNGLVHNANRNNIQSEITLDDLFQPML